MIDDEKLPKIPDSWVWVELKDLSKLIMGQSPPGNSYNKENQGVPLLNGAADYQGKLIIPRQYTTKPTRMAKKDDILLCIRATLGKTRLSDSDYCIGRGLAAIRTNNNLVDKKYLLNFIDNEIIRLSQLAKGTTISGFNKTDLESMQIPLPPLAEQQRIVERLKELTHHLNQANAELTIISRKLEQYRQSILNALVNLNLIPEGHVTIPKADWFPLESVVNSLNQGWSPKCHNEPSNDDETWGVIKTTAIQKIHYNETANKILPSNLTPRPELEIKDGDMLITRAGPRWRVGITCLVKKTRPKLMLCDKAYRLRLNVNLIDPEYLVMLLNSPHFIEEINKIKTGISDSGVNLTQKRLLNIPIPVHSKSLQTELLTELKKRLSQHEASNNALQDYINKCKSLRYSILKSAFQGKLTPQDPNEEPASVLLNRIKEEKKRMK